MINAIKNIMPMKEKYNWIHHNRNYLSIAHSPLGYHKNVDKNL
jgi:hypothetical protein